MNNIIPCLWFEDRCEEAVNFYVSVFKGAPAARGESKIMEIQKYPEGIKDAPWPKEVAGKVLTAVFELNGQRFMALDGGPGVFPKSGPVSLLIECGSQAEVDYYWDKLSAGGDPKAQQCGWLADKYGFAWQVNPVRLGELLSSPDREKANRAMEAMLRMKKLDIAELERAYEGGAVA